AVPVRVGRRHHHGTPACAARSSRTRNGRPAPMADRGGPAARTGTTPARLRDRLRPRARPALRVRLRRLQSPAPVAVPGSDAARSRVAPAPLRNRATNRRRDRLGPPALAGAPPPRAATVGP